MTCINIKVDSGLQGKVAIVLAESAGIGWGIAEALPKRDAIWQSVRNPMEN